MKEFIWTLALVILTSITAFGQTDEARRKNFNIKKNIAIEGYDPVSYFDNNPRKGSAGFQVSFKGVTYLFVNSANVSRFKSTPEKFEPAYGGWCAYAMGATGEKVKVDPETYKVLDGKLYLFYNFWGSNTLTDWNMNERGLKIKGDENWKKFTP